MQKKPPDSPKKPDAPKGAGTRGDDADKAHRHRFSDGEKTTIMPLSEILKARDAARGTTPPPSEQDQFPEFSYQPTVRVAIPAEMLKRKQAEAAREAAARGDANKENTKTHVERAQQPKAADAARPEHGVANAKKATAVAGTQGPAVGQTPQHMTSGNMVLSGEYTLKDNAQAREVTQPRVPETRPVEAKKPAEPNTPPALPPEPKSPPTLKAEPRLPPDLKPAEPKQSEPKQSEPKQTEPKAAPFKAAEPKAAEPKAAEPGPVAAALAAAAAAAAAPSSKTEEPLPSIAAPMASPQVPAAPDNTNQVVVFFSCKGGSGATALSTNVAHYCASSKKKTVLVDLDLQLGDALAAMSLQPAMTIAKAMEETQRGGNISTMPLPRHQTGVSVLSQVGSLDDLDKISSEGISRFVEGLRANFDTIIVDGVRDFSDNVLAVLDMADKIAIVTVQEVLAIKRARWAYGILRKIGFDGRDITVVVNRYTADEMIPFPTLKQMFDPAPVFAVPADGPLVLQSLNRGTPLLELNAQHTVTRNITRLAKNLLGEQLEDMVEATVVAKSSFWDRLRPGKRE